MPSGLEKKKLLLERGASVEEVSAWEQATRDKLAAAGAGAAEIDTYFGAGPAEVGAIDRLHPAASLRPGPEVEAAAPADGPRRPKTIVEAWTAGQQTSLTGLATRGRGPDIALGDKEPLYLSIASAFGTLAGDLPVVLPSFMAAFPLGAKIGGVTGGVSSKANPIATAAGATFGGLAAGGFVSGFVAEDLRASMLEFYEENKGRNVGRREFVVGVAAKALTQEILARANKEGAINAAGAIVGGPVAGKLAAANPFVRGVAVGSAEMAGSVAFASALEGELPDANEFGTMAAVAVVGGGLAGGIESAAPRVKADEDVRKQVERRLKKTYKGSGKKPAEVVREAEPDPAARERLITGEGLAEPDTVYTEVPPQDASPAEKPAAPPTPPPPPPPVYDRAADEAKVRADFPIEKKNTLWKDTRGGGERYHGARGDIEGLFEGGGYSPVNFYGQGFYVTDAVDVAAGYVRGNKLGAIYRVKEQSSVNALDMEQPIPEWLLLGLENYDIIAGAVEDASPKNVRELFDSIREFGTSEGLSADDIQENFDLLQTRILENGFNAMDHRGGLRTGAEAHAVRIYLQPETSVSIEKVLVDDFRFEKSNFDLRQEQSDSAQAEHANKYGGEEVSDPTSGFGEEERLRIHEENVDPAYVKEGKTAWSQYSRALRGKRPAQGPAPESTDLVVFDGAGGGKKPPPPPEGADAADGPATQADLDAILGKTGRDPKKRQVKDIDDLRFEVIDDLQFVKSFASSAYEAAYGKKLAMERNPGELMALARGADAIAQQHITRGFFSRDAGQKVAPSLKDVFKVFKTGAQREAASAYFIAKRVLEKEAQGFATGFDLDAARRIVNSAEKRPDVVSSRDTKRAFDKAGVEWVRDAGVISAKSADTILAQNEDFIPFFALGKDQSAEFAKRGFQVRQPFKKFTGGDIKLVDPVEALVKNHFYMVRMAENNRARLRVAAFNNALPKAFRIMDRMTPVPKAKKSKPMDAEFTDIGDPIVRDLFDEIPDGSPKDPGVKRLQDWTEAGQKDLNDKFEAAQHDPERALVVSNEDGSASVITIDDLAKNTPDIRRFMEDNGLEAGDVTWLHVAGELDRRFQKTGDIVVFEDGRPIVYRARDPRLAKSFEHLTRGELNFVTKVLAIPARVVRTTITTFPTFIKDALIRDTVDAALINKFKWTPVIDTVDGVMQTLMKSADFERYVANGGAGAALADIDADLRALSVTRFGVQDSPITKARNAVASGFRAMYSIGATADQFNRAAAAKKAFAAGKSGETGALRGRKVSLDFSQAGASMYSWNQIVAFLGPTINGIDRAVLAARSPAHLAVVGMTYLTLPSIMLWAANADQEWYKGLTASEKARNWYFRIGGSENNPVLARVPKPHAWAALFSTAPEYILDNLHKKRNPNLAKDMLSAFEREWIPQLGELSAVTPFTEVAANHSGFLDRPIVSKRLEENVLPQFRYTPYTSETAKAAARLMPDFVPERFRTPIAIDHLIGAFTNTQGRSILSIAEGILGSAGIIEKTPTSRSQLANSAVIRSFLEEGPRFRATLDEFYQRVDRANQVNGTYKELIRQGDIAEAQKLVDKYGAQMVKAQQVEVAVGSIFTMVRMVEFNKTMSPEEKQQLVNQYMSFATSVADTFNQQMRAIEEAPKEKK